MAWFEFVWSFEVNGNVAHIMTEKSGSRRRAPTAAEAERIRKAIAEESRPEVMAANRAVGQRLLAQKQQAATAAAEVLAQLLAEKERQQLSLSDLQERTGIGRSNLSRLWNQADPKVTLETVERIAAALHCKLRVTLESTP